MSDKIKTAKPKGIDVIIEMTNGKKILYHPRNHFNNSHDIFSEEFIAKAKVGSRGELIFPNNIDVCADSIEYYGEEIK